MANSVNIILPFLFTPAINKEKHDGIYIWKKREKYWENVLVFIKIFKKKKENDNV